MKILLLSILFISTLGSLFSQQFSWQWYKNVHDNDLQTVNDVVVDSVRGFVYAVGTFEGNLSSDFIFGSNSVVSRGNRDGFVAQFDLQGNCIWSFNIGGEGDDGINAIDIDKATGDIYIVGSGIQYGDGFWDDKHFKFGDAQGIYRDHSNSNDGGRKEDIIAAKYNFLGDFQWSNIDGGRKFEAANDVTVLQGLDRVVYTGSFISSSGFGYGFELGGGSDVDPGNSNRHLFIIARDKAVGTRVWRGYSEDTGSQKGVSITNDGTNVYLLGNYKKVMNIEVDLNDNTNTNLGTLINPSGQSAESIFYSKFDATTGSPFWLKSIGSPDEDEAGDIKTANNKIYIGGGVGNGVSFDNSPPFVMSPGLNMFVSEHNLSGGYLGNILEQNLTANNRSMVTSLDFTNDYLVAGGFTSGSILFNNQPTETLTSLGNLDGFVAFYTPTNLSYVGREHIFGSGHNEPKALATIDRNVYVGGRYGLGASLNNDISMLNVGNKTGFLSYLAYQCTTSLSYSSSSICNESPVLNPVFSPSGGSFSFVGSNSLNLNVSTGVIDPFQSDPGNYQVVYSDLIGCSDTFDLEIEAGLPPQFTSCPSDYTVYTNNSSCGATYLYSEPTYSTDCGSNTLTQTDGTNIFSGDVFPVGTTIQEFVLTDGYNPNDTCQFTITVIDTISPSFNNCPTNDVIAYSGVNSCNVMVDYGTITATDNCGTVTTILSVGLPTNSSFPLDTTAISITSTDSYLNSSTCSFNVVVVDTVAPAFTNCVTDNDSIYYVTSGSCTAEIVFDEPLATDNCDFRVFQNDGVQSGTTQAPGNLYYREFTAIDSSGVFSICRENYRVLDTLRPTITCPSDTVLDADISTCLATYSYLSPTVEDNCSLYSSTANQIDASGFISGDDFPIGITNQEFEIQDVHGNTSTCSFTVTVNNVTDAGTFTGVLDGVCSDAGSIDLSQYVDASLNGTWTGNGISVNNFNASSAIVGTNELLYVVGGASCSDTVVHQIEVYDFIVNAGLDDSLCGLSIELDADDVVGAYQSWIQQYSENYQTLSSPNSVVTVGASGIYDFVWKIQKDQCIKTDTVQVLFYELPIADAGNDQTVEVNEVELDALLNSGNGFWSVVSSDGIIEDSLLENTTVTDLNLGLNTFEWVVENGMCPVSIDLVRVFYDYLQIPNAFTPNGDGVNDFFYIVGFDLQSEAELTIIDRWGEKIFYTNDVGEYWDGTYKGKQVVADTYFYILYIRGKELTGYIELRR